MTTKTNAPTIRVDGGGANKTRASVHGNDSNFRATSPSVTLPPLSPDHLNHLHASAIADDVIAARGYQTVTAKTELHELGYGRGQQRVPTLLMPVWSISGGIATYQHRPDKPRVVDGKPLKYETPAKSGMNLDVHPFIVEKARDPRVPLIITEGVKKADAAISAGLCCIALLGVWNWRGRNDHGGMTTLPDWEMVAFKHADGTPREIAVCFDSDVMLKRAVHAAMKRLAAFIESRGASVTFIYLPDGPDGTKSGLDDYVAAGHTKTDLLNLRTPTLRECPDSGTERPHPYRETPGGLVWDKPTGDGTMSIPLMNFNARITTEDALDDGVTRTLNYGITATLPDGAERRADVPAAQFDAMNWVSTLGMDCIMEPGQSVKDRARHAIKTLSTDAERRTVYTHTGWTKRDGRWLYLHAGGAIGEGGEGITVQLPPALALYQLPMEPDPDPVQSVAATIRLARLCPAITYPLIAAVFRAPMGAAEYSAYVTGETGTFKSTLAALLQQHYGPGMMDTASLPANWSATPNYLEMLAFQCKDAILTVDEAVSTGARHDREKLAAAQNRVLRAQGNQSGRGRMTADGRLKPEHPPRGLIITTGEQPAAGHSLNARLLLLELEPGMITLDRIGPCQRDGAAGLYARTLAGYIADLARDFDARRMDHQSRAAALYQTFQDAGGHARVPKMLADLLAAWEGFTAWVASIGAVSDADAKRLVSECRDALIAAGNDQARHITDAEPTARYLDFLTQCLASGRAHLLDATGGDRPGHNPQANGWRRVDGGQFGPDWKTGGDHIGWVDADGVYLLKDAAFSVAQSLARDSGHDIPLDANTMARRLRDRNRLATWEGERGKLSIRKSFPNAGRAAVLHVREWRAADVCASPDDDGCMVSQNPAQQAQQAQDRPADAQIGPVCWAGSDDDRPRNRPNTGPPSRSNAPSDDANGPVGPVGPVSQPYTGPNITGDTHAPAGNGNAANVREVF